MSGQCWCWWTMQQCVLCSVSLVLILQIIILLHYRHYRLHHDSDCSLPIVRLDALCAVPGWLGGGLGYWTLWENFRGQRTARLVVLEREDCTVLYPVACQHVTGDITLHSPHTVNTLSSPTQTTTTTTTTNNTSLTSQISPLSQQSAVKAGY